MGLRTANITRRSCWALACIITLGYASKYLRRVRSWQAIGPSYYDDEPQTRQSLKQSQKAKQQKEWDRLSVVLSVVAAACASALAIPSPLTTPDMFWASAACFSAAFGLSLEGLILITYLNVYAGAGGTGRLSRLSSRKPFQTNTIGPVAFVLALPITFTTYASFYLLIGLLSMTIARGKTGEVQSHIGAYKAVILVPVLTALSSIVVSIVGCEVSLSEGSSSSTQRSMSRNQNSDVLAEEQVPFKAEE